MEEHLFSIPLPKKGTQLQCTLYKREYPLFVVHASNLPRTLAPALGTDAQDVKCTKITLKEFNANAISKN